MQKKEFSFKIKYIARISNILVKFLVELVIVVPVTLVQIPSIFLI